MLRILLLILFVAIGWFKTDGLAQYGKQTGHPDLDRANALYEIGRYEESKAIFSNLLDAKEFETGTKLWVIANLGLGSSLLDLGDPVAPSVVIAADSLANDDLPLELKAYIKKQLAWAHGRLGLAQKRIEYYNQGYEIALESGDEFRIADLRINMADIQLEAEENQKALEYAQQAADYFRTQDATFHLTLALRDLSYAYRNLALLEKAAYPIVEAVELAEQANNSDLLLDWFYFIAADLFKASNRFDLALYYYNKQLALAESSGSYLSMSNLTHDIGATYSFMGDTRKALEYYNRSIEYRERASMPKNFITISNIGLCYMQLGEYELSKQTLTEALEGFRGSNNRYRIALTFQQLSQLYLVIGETDRAHEYAEQALRLSLEMDNRDLQLSSYQSLARAYQGLGEMEEGLPYFKKAYQLASGGRGAKLVESLMDLTRALREVGSDSTYYYADLAIKEIEWANNHIYGDHLQTENFRRYASFFEMVAEWHLTDSQDIETAFRLIEQGKSRTLLDHLSSKPIESLLDESSSLKLRQLAKSIDRQYRLLEDESDPEKQKTLRFELQDMELNYQSALNEVRLMNPDLKKFEPPRIISIEELQQRLDRKSAVLQFSVRGNKVNTIWITRSESGFFTSDLSAQDSLGSLTDQVTRFRASIQNTEPFTELRQSSGTLYEQLISPFKTIRPEIHKLLIIPEGPLTYLPFEALISPDGRFMIEDYELKYLPSASTLSFIQNPHRETDKELLAVAGSGFETGGAFNETRSQSGFASLPATLMEVDSIAAHFTNSLRLKNEEVSESAIKSLSLGDYKYLHFATHGLLNEENPGQSGLLLSKKNNAESLFGEDGLLNSGEISLLSLNADMVVLSACNTGYGRNVPGEGLLGLQRSFLKAGASSVVVSLWDVMDRSTALLMSSFYRTLNDYEQEEFGLWNSALKFLNLYEPPLFDYKSRALRDAKLNLLRSPYYHHPIHWAPFIYIGK